MVIKYHLFGELSVEDSKPFSNLLLILLCITSGIICIKRMQDWGGYRSRVGKVLLFYSIGFFAWAAGSIIWSYHGLFLGTAVPFPGWPDLAYVFINPAFITGFGLFGYITALRNQKNQTKQKFYFYLIPICMALVTFYFISTIGRGNTGTDDTLATLLNFYYTGGDIVILVVLMLFGGTTFNYLGERLRLPFTLALSAIVASYIADTLYAYTTATGTYTNGGITDFFYALLLFLLAVAAHALHPRLLEDEK
ncbi:MAG TPA: hypothetical protein DEG44_00100 [Candidatus Kerfeldbacteria bacterium]|nr:hypothetical protein [Candidatus Kerfeldbacteria bacterium]